MEIKVEMKCLHGLNKIIIHLILMVTIGLPLCYGQGLEQIYLFDYEVAQGPPTLLHNKPSSDWYTILQPELMLKPFSPYFKTNDQINQVRLQKCLGFKVSKLPMPWRFNVYSIGPQQHQTLILRFGGWEQKSGNKFPVAKELCISPLDWFILHITDDTGTKVVVLKDQ